MPYQLPADIEAMLASRFGGSPRARVVQLHTTGQRDSLEAIAAWPAHVITPEHLPPGWAYDDTGMPRPLLRAVGTGSPVASAPVGIYDPTLGRGDPLAYLYATLSMLQERWTAGGAQAFAPPTLPNAWKPLYSVHTLSSGSITDSEVLATVASVKFDCVIMRVDVLAITSATQANLIITYQDSDNAAVTGTLSTRISYLYDNTSAVPRFFGDSKWHGAFGACRFITPTANRALEVDISGGLGAEVVVLQGVYRQI